MEFVSNNGTPDVQEVVALLDTNTTFGTLNTNPVVMRPTHPQDREFLGWSASPGGAVIPDTEQWVQWSPRRVYARWGPGEQVNPYQIAIGFHGNGGTPEHQMILADLQDDGVTYVLRAAPGTVTRMMGTTSLDFLGWFAGALNFDDAAPFTYASPREFYAQWDEFFLEFRFDGDNSNPNPRSFDYIRIPVTPGQPIDWTASTDAAYVYAIDCEETTGTFGPGVDTLVQGWAFWGWFDNITERADGRYRPLVGSIGWSDLLFDPDFYFDEQDFEDLGDGLVISFTGIWSLWGDADDSDQVDALDVQLINEWIYDDLLIWMGLDPHFDNPINLRASRVTLPADGVVSANDVQRINEWLYDELLGVMGLDPHFFAVLGAR